jgi:hypothetical protein
VDVGSVLANMIVIPALPGFRANSDLHVDLGVGDRSIDLIGEVDCVIRGANLVTRRWC